MTATPIICIPCNTVKYQDARTHAVKHPYVRAVMELTGCVPLLIPALGENFSLKQIAGRIDGILLTGSSSNVCPRNYGQERTFEEKDLDLDRDATNLPLIREAIALDIPLFAICRGFQEMNVACGGSLHQHVQDLPGKMDHRGDYTLSPAELYLQQKHNVTVQKGGLFERLGLPPVFSVNSIHQQGIDRLGAGLQVEAVADDGLIEAFSVPGKRFVVGTQWHPEGDFWVNASSKKLLEAFGSVVRAKA